MQWTYKVIISMQIHEYNKGIWIGEKLTSQVSIRKKECAFIETLSIISNYAKWYYSDTWTLAVNLHTVVSHWQLCDSGQIICFIFVMFVDKGSHIPSFERVALILFYVPLEKKSLFLHLMCCLKDGSTAGRTLHQNSEPGFYAQGMTSTCTPL